MALTEAVALAAAASGRWRLAGLVLGLSLAVKPVLLPLLLLPVLWRRWEALPVAALALAVPTALAALVVPSSSAFLTMLAPTLGQGPSTAQLGTDIAIPV